MAYTATQLVNEAFYVSGIVARQFATVSGDQASVGLLKLNELLSDTDIMTEKIPYINTKFTFSAVPGQEEYFIPGLAKAETLTFFIQSIRYQMLVNPFDRYFGSGRAQNVLSLPFNWISVRTRGGSNIFLYFFPDVNYPMELTGLFSLQQVQPYQDLAAVLTTANLGTPIITGIIPNAGLIQPGQLVINGIDLAGTYNTPQALLAFINTGIIPNVTATITGTEFILYNNTTNSSIFITTSGVGNGANNFSFSNFSLLNGPHSYTYLPQGLDQYYISYLIYKLAERLCAAYDFSMPPMAAKILAQYEESIDSRSTPRDLTISKISTLSNNVSVNYAQVNIGKGWTP